MSKTLLKKLREIAQSPWNYGYVRLANAVEAAASAWEADRAALVTAGNTAVELAKKLAEAEARIEALEAKYWRYRLYITGYVKDGQAIDEEAALAAEPK